MEARGGGEGRCRCPSREAAAPGREQGPRRRLGSWIPRRVVRSPPPTSPGAAGGRARVLPALGALGRVPSGELGSFGPLRRGPGRGPCGMFPVVVGEPNVKLTVSQRPISSGGIFFFFLSSLHLWGNALFR